MLLCLWNIKEIVVKKVNLYEPLRFRCSWIRGSELVGVVEEIFGWRITMRFKTYCDVDEAPVPISVLYGYGDFSIV